MLSDSDKSIIFAFQKNNVLDQPIVIKSHASISALGHSEAAVWKAYLNADALISTGPFMTSNLTDESKKRVEAIAKENNKYKNLDPSVLFALFATRQAVEKAGWNQAAHIGINMGSSRGATALFENYYDQFKASGRAETLTSPSTTLGNISTWLAHDLQTTGPAISHSITCSTALHAFLNGIAWLKSGLSTQFIVGGSEAANTPFTVAQMQALKIYASSEPSAYPCRSLDFNKSQNTMVLGEGAASFCLELGEKTSHYPKIIGYGYATEIVNHSASISANADCFQDSMQMALQGHAAADVDAIVMHAPGTIKGDLSEFNAIKAVFGKDLPALTSNKWKIGHALGASGAFSVEMALLMMKYQTFIESPFYKHEHPPKTLNKVLVNAVGFGGNAVSLLLSV